MHRKYTNSIIEVFIFALLINPFIYNSHASLQRNIIYFFMMVYLVINLNHTLSMFSCLKKEFSLISLLLILWQVLDVITPIINSTYDFSMLYNVWYAVAMGLPFLTICVYENKKAGATDTLQAVFGIYACGVALYVVGTIMILLIPALRNFILKYAAITPNDYKYLQFPQYKTRIGWAGFSAYGMALKCTVAFVMAFYVFVKENELKGKIKYGIVLFLTFLGNIFYARTGIIACILVFGIFMFFESKKKHKIKSFIGTLAIIIIAYFVVRYLLENYQSNTAIAWIFESFLNGNDRGLNTYSTESLSNMIFMPRNLSTFLFGDGYYTYNGRYYMRTDVGFMRLMLYGGIFFTALLYLVVILSLHNLSKYKGIGTRLFWYFLVIFLVFEAKGESVITLLPIIMISAIESWYINLDGDCFA